MKLSFRQYLLREKNEDDEQTSGENQIFTKKEPLTASCSLSLDDIFVQLHKKAVESVGKDYQIVNSAIDDEQKKLISAGQHIISIVKNKEKFSKEEALEPLKTYVQWFSGPDLKDKVNLDSIFPLPDNEGNDSKENETKAESLEIPSFLNYLVEDKEISSDKLDSEAKDKQQKAEDKESKKSKDEEAEYSGELATGWYISYEMKIEGQKESTISDAFKSLAKGLINGLGFATFDWRSGALGKTHTIGDFLDSWDKVFGKIKPDEFKSRFDKNIKVKLPKTTVSTEFFDKNTISQNLKKLLQSKDKAKIKNTDYSFCVKIPHNDISQKLINTTVIADLATQSIKGIFKKLKNKLTKDDIVLINSYSGEKQVEPGKVEGESIINQSLLNLLFEAVEIDPELRKKVISRLKKFDNWEKELSNYKGDLTGGSKYLSNDKNGRFKKGDSQTNEWVIKAIHRVLSDMNVTIQNETLKAINSALDEIENNKNKNVENENQDLVDEILDKLQTFWNSEYVKSHNKEIKNTKEYKKFTTIIDEYKNLKNTIESKSIDKVKEIISKIDKRKQLIALSQELDNIIDYINKQSSDSDKIKDKLNDLKKRFENIKDSFTDDPNSDNYEQDIKNKPFLDDLFKKKENEIKNDDLSKAEKIINSKEEQIEKEKAEKQTKQARADKNKDLIDKIINLIRDNEIDDVDKHYLTPTDYNEEKYRDELNGKKDTELNKIYEDLKKKIDQKRKSLIRDLAKRIKSGEYTEDELKQKTPKELAQISTPNVKYNKGQYDFYIIPMKGLKFDNTDDDDEKEYAGKDNN